MKVPFLGGAYGGRSSNVSAQECINLYFEPPPKHESNDGSLVPPSGATVFADCSQGPVRGGFNYRNIAYFVAGDKLYEVSSGGTVTQRGGTLATNAGRVSIMANNANQMMILDGTNGYIYDPIVKSLTTISDVDFVGTSMGVFQDGYFITVQPNTNRFSFSDLNNGFSWGGIEASAEGNPDYLVSMLSDRRELWLFGEQTTEVWYNQGDPDTPFTRFQNGYVESGIAAKFSVAKHDNSVVWLAKNARGEAQVVRAGDGWQPVVISTGDVDYQIQQYQRVDDAWAYTYQYEGHEFYVLNFPSAGAVWAYDARTQEWAQRAHVIDNVFPSRERYNCYVFAYGKHLLGDYSNGKVYELSSDVYTVDSMIVPRIRTSQAITAENEARVSIVEFQLDMEEGVSDATVWLSYSKDGGHTWSDERERSVGGTGKYAHRVIWRKLGMGRHWIFRIRTWSSDRTVIKGAYARFYGEEY